MPPLVGEAQGEAGPLLARLQGLRAAAALIARTRDKDDARVMLGCLLKDLGGLAGLDAEAMPVRTAALLAELEAEAAALRKRLGKTQRRKSPGSLRRCARRSVSAACRTGRSRELST